jgi:hypothetical protein
MGGLIGWMDVYDNIYTHTSCVTPSRITASSMPRLSPYAHAGGTPSPPSPSASSSAGLCMSGEVARSGAPTMDAHCPVACRCARPARAPGAWARARARAWARAWAGAWDGAVGMGPWVGARAREWVAASAGAWGGARAWGGGVSRGVCSCVAQCMVWGKAWLVRPQACMPGWRAPAPAPPRPHPPGRCASPMTMTTSSHGPLSRAATRLPRSASCATCSITASRSCGARALRRRVCEGVRARAWACGGGCARGRV